MLTYIMVTLACFSGGCEFERTQWQSFRLTVPAVFSSLEACEEEKVHQQGMNWNKGLNLHCVALKDRKDISGRITMPEENVLVAIPQTCPPEVPPGECRRPREVQTYRNATACLSARVKIESEWYRHEYRTHYVCRVAGSMP